MRSCLWILWSVRQEISEISLTIIKATRPARPRLFCFLASCCYDAVPGHESAILDVLKSPGQSKARNAEPHVSQPELGIHGIRNCCRASPESLALPRVRSSLDEGRLELSSAGSREQLVVGFLDPYIYDESMAELPCSTSLLWILARTSENQAGSVEMNVRFLSWLTLV